MKLLITGGSGFIGTNLVARMHRLGAQVQSLDVRPPRNPGQAAFWKRVDILDAPALSEAVGEFGPTHVVHLAARTDLHGRGVADYRANYDGVTNLIQALARLQQSPRTVYASSRLVFRIGHTPRHDYDYDPSTPYGESKILGEQIIRSEAGAGGAWTIARPTSIWGPWFATPYRDFFDLVARGRYVNPSGHDVFKSFGYVANTVYEIQKLLEENTSTVAERVFWLTDYPPTLVSEWAETVADLVGARRPRTAPMWALRTAASIGDALRTTGAWKNPPLTSFRLNNLITPMVYDTTALESIVGPLPYTMDQGVQRTVEWLKSQQLGR
ncbi:NAD(P)-dependent oxidoreductase [Microbacterium sp. NPDC096154]|uniref:NAD-dependent epimerase/dehydratase family protein n=1 Tax=Microbacterium sp. NPDC096154 TaxID=3155549 RepID=UPI003331ED62